MKIISSQEQYDSFVEKEAIYPGATIPFEGILFKNVLVNIAYCLTLRNCIFSNCTIESDRAVTVIIADEVRFYNCLLRSDYTAIEIIFYSEEFSKLVMSDFYIEGCSLRLSKYVDDKHLYAAYMSNFNSKGTVSIINDIRLTAVNSIMKELHVNFMSCEYVDVSCEHIVVRPRLNDTTYTVTKEWFEKLLKTLERSSPNITMCVDFKNCDFSGIVFPKMVLQECVFEDCNLDGIDITQVEIKYDMRLIGTCFNNVKMNVEQKNNIVII